LGKKPGIDIISFKKGAGKLGNYFFMEKKV